MWPMRGAPGGTALTPNLDNRGVSPMNADQLTPRVDFTSRSVLQRQRVAGRRAFRQPGLLFSVWVAAALATPASAQIPTTRFGETVPRDVREMYDRGLQFLA